MFPMHFFLQQTIAAIYGNINGSPTSYTVIFSDLTSGSICDLSTVPSAPNNCDNGNSCQLQWHKFAISSPCSYNHDISVSVFATNILGNGPFSEPVIFKIETSESNYCSKLIDVTSISEHASLILLCRCDPWYIRFKVH